MRALFAFAFLSLVILAGASQDGAERSSPTRPQGAPLTATPDCGLAWRVVTSPNPGGTDGTYLYQVAALTPQEIWAVGDYSHGSNVYTLVVRWDGTIWRVIPSPSAGTRASLVGLAALAPDDLWAVGVSYETSIGQLTLIEHWDGQTWQIVPSPNPYTGTNILRSVAAVSPNDVWAVGDYVHPTLGQQTLIEHWDGQTWQIVPSPNMSGGNVLFSIAAVSAQDIWAVGHWDNQNGARTLTMHWDGATWQIVASPNPDPTGSDLNGMTALGSTDIWAVGNTHLGTLTLHWDGATWEAKPSPNPPNTPGAYLLGMAARAPNDVWAVGYAVASLYAPATALHWDGAAWTLVPPPDPPSGEQDVLRGAVVLPDGTVWAVGDADRYGVERTLVERYSDPCVSPTPTTSTTPTATPTACGITFADVDPANPFYGFIRCLACRGIVSGYADGTFRWGATVTRGQVAKILANAARLTTPVPTTQQTFADVPSANPFWVFVERLAATGAISGYACGGPGELCDPQNRPYFRWGTK